jgi:hypothetical protein
MKQHLTLTVYDITGREITRLVDGQKEAGTYQVQFNSHAIPSGLYFYTIRTENFSQTKKMAVIK